MIDLPCSDFQSNFSGSGFNYFCTWLYVLCSNDPQKRIWQHSGANGHFSDHGLNVINLWLNQQCSHYRDLFGR
ncbi:hypothetical protein AHF37_04386 [Paragonimus kellicotti]|nr:hypothetical protein AHF37_04386 [Paragonimus kellicotti]